MQWGYSISMVGNGVFILMHYEKYQTHCNLRIWVDFFDSQDTIKIISSLNLIT